jgi:hypothetical protein
MSTLRVEQVEKNFLTNAYRTFLSDNRIANHLVLKPDIVCDALAYSYFNAKANSTSQSSSCIDTTFSNGLIRIQMKQIIRESVNDADDELIIKVNDRTVYNLSKNIIRYGSRDLLKLMAAVREMVDEMRQVVND